MFCIRPNGVRGSRVNNPQVGLVITAGTHIICIVLKPACQPIVRETERDRQSVDGADLKKQFKLHIAMPVYTIILLLLYRDVAMIIN